MDYKHPETCGCPTCWGQEKRLQHPKFYEEIDKIINGYTTNYSTKIPCKHKYIDGNSALDYMSSYEMRSDYMFCKICGLEGSRKDLSE